MRVQHVCCAQRCRFSNCVEIQVSVRFLDAPPSVGHRASAANSSKALQGAHLPRLMPAALCRLRDSTAHGTPSLHSHADAS